MFHPIFSAIGILMFMASCTSVPSPEEAQKEIIAFRHELNEHYKNPDDTPLKGNNVAKFTEHPFYPINFKYRVVAKVHKEKNPIPFEIPTSSGRSQMYRKYGVATFQIAKATYQLHLYQNMRNLESEKYKNYLFLPFKDQTNGSTTYAGGRYIDVQIPHGNTLIIDFNQAYNPYCAYTAEGFSCPLVPEENHLPIDIAAGVMYDQFKWYEE